jgi:hypothetical protein
MRRRPPTALGAAVAMAVLVVISISDRDPSPFTWLLVALFAACAILAIRERR